MAGIPDGKLFECEVCPSQETMHQKIEMKCEEKEQPKEGHKTTVSSHVIPVRRSARLKSEARATPIVIAAKKYARQQQQAKKTDFVIRDAYQLAQEAKNMVRKETGVIYDLQMQNHRCLWDENYPECPERFKRVLSRCEELGLLKRCKYISPRYASEEEVLTKHAPERVQILKDTHNCTNEELLEKLSSKYDSIYIHPSTYEVSLLAAGCCIELVDNICAGHVQNGMAIVRPPGHHAMENEYCGYCFYNNVAIAATHAIKKHGLERILIVDWDVHHGQATQQMFYEDPRVLYFSIHRYEHGSFWPGLRQSDYHYIGEGRGLGYNFNVPLNTVGMANSDYMAIFHQLLLPLAVEFQPQLILVSAGYDAAIGCPEGEMEVTPACYAHLLSCLLGLASGKVAVVLEGGYCVKSLAEGAALTLRCLLGDPCPMIESLGPPCQSIQETILDVIYTHRQYWRCFQFQPTHSINDTREPGIIYHTPQVKFLGTDEKPDSYETRNCYPTQNLQMIEEIDRRLNSLNLRTSLSCPPHRVCLVYDEHMLKHQNLSQPHHPERPERIQQIFIRHEEYGLIDRCYRLQARKVTKEELMLIHSETHIEKMVETCTMTTKELTDLQGTFNSVYLHPDSYESALVAAGSVLQVVDSVLNGESRSGVAIVRPPGHHAEEHEPCGFCIFNNVSLAAKYAIDIHGVKRILLVDWDVHHGNGTQHLFESDPRVLYISLHRYDNGRFFPNSTDANYTETGSGNGEGFNINIPWNKRGMGDGDYVAAFHQIVLPVAYQYNPELVLISAGFDAAAGDPLGGCKLSPEVYGHMTHWLSSLANGKVVLSLEGGYNTTAISYALTMCSKALLGDPLPCLREKLIPDPSAVTSINNVISMHKKYWSCLTFQVSLPAEDVLHLRKGKVSSEESTSELEIKIPKIEDMSILAQVDKNDISFSLAEVENLHISNQNREELHSYHQHCDNFERELPLVQSIPQICDNDSAPTGMQRTDSFARTVPTSSDSNTNNNREDQRDSVDRGQGEQGTSSTPGSSASGASGGGQTLVDYLSDNMQLLLDERMFAVVPLPGCPHLDRVEELPEGGINTNAPCQECESMHENWVCLTCYTVHCGRYINGHMVLHGSEHSHPLTLSFSDLSVWCYSCEAYIDNAVLYKAKNAAHLSKFGEEMPWSYS